MELPRPPPRQRAVSVGAVLLAVALAGCLNDFDEERLNVATIRSIDVSAPEVGSGIVTLVANITILNQHDESGKLALLVKAHNTATGLLVETAEVPVAPIARDRSASIAVPLRLPKEDGYRLTVVLMQEGTQRHQATVTVNQVGALAVNVVQTGLAVFALEFVVRNASDDAVAIDAQVYLTNEGHNESAPLRLQVKAREVSTGLLSDEQWTDVDAIAIEATRITTVPLEVPAEYNYLVEAVLWDGDHRVGSGEGRVQLLPTFTLPPEEQVVVQRPDVSDFVRDHDEDRLSGDDSEGTPAPSAVLVVLALAAMIAWSRRRMR